jgi:hypothetical protein
MVKQIPIAQLLKLKPQTRKILNHLSKHGSITPMEALTVYSIYRLSACIHDLRKTGISIITQMKEDASGHRYARYEVLA